MEKIEVTPRFKGGDKVFRISDDGKIEPQDVACCKFEGTVSRDGSVHVRINYSLYGWIAGTLFSEKDLYANREEAEQEMLRKSREKE